MIDQGEVPQLERKESILSQMIENGEENLEFLKPQAYFSYLDFTNLYEEATKSFLGFGGKKSQKAQQQKSDRQDKDKKLLKKLAESKDPTMRLLCAKSCFVSEDYQQCIEILKNIKPNTSKLLYQRTAFLMQASYLINPSNSQQIKQIWNQYLSTKSTYENIFINHLQETNLLNIKETALSFEEVQERCLDIDWKSLREEMKCQKFEKHIEGIPTYLISERWLKQLTAFLLQESNQPPGPMTNFQLTNYLYEYSFIHQKKQKIDPYMDTIMFPVLQDIHYSVLNASFWKSLHKIFGGIAISRVYMKNPIYRVLDGSNNILRIIVYKDDKMYIFQVQAGSQWQHTVFSRLNKKFGHGQLKFIIGKQYHVQNPGKITKIKKKYIFVNYDRKAIKTNSAHEKQIKKNLMLNYDMEKFSITNSKTHGKFGIILDPPRSSSMNSVLQVLSQSTQFSEYFLTNSYHKDMNLSTRNTEGWFGEIACSLAQIFKKLYFSIPQQSFSYNSSKFKQLVYKTLIQDVEIDDNDQKCLPPLQKKTEKKKKLTRIQKFMKFKEIPPQVKNIQRDPAILFRILFKALASDLSQQRIFERPITTIAKKSKFRDSERWRLYNSVRDSYLEMNNSIISKLFTGFDSFEEQCRICSNRKLTIQPFRVFDLAIPLDNPREAIYYVPNRTLKQQAVKIEFYTEGIKNVRDLINTLRKELKISEQQQLAIYMVDPKFNFIQEEVSLDYDIKNLYEDLHLIKRVLFVYALIPSSQNEIQALILYRFVGFQFKDDVADGFPRILPINPELLTEQNQIQLKDYILKTIPVAVYEASKSPCISKILSQMVIPDKKAKKQKRYQVVVTVQSKNPVKNFKYIRNRQIIGKRQPDIFLTLDNCFFNIQYTNLINMDEVNYCQICKKNRNVDVSRFIFEIGELFIIRLNRFQKGCDKITSMINYPVEDFQISKFLKKKSFVNRYYEKLKKKQEKKAMKPSVDLINSSPDFYYNLIGVIVQKGQKPEDSMYHAILKVGQEGWFQFRNQKVKKIQVKDVVVRDAYILIYEKGKSVKEESDSNLDNMHVVQRMKRLRETLYESKNLKDVEDQDMIDKSNKKQVEDEQYKGIRQSIFSTWLQKFRGFNKLQEDEQNKDSQKSHKRHIDKQQNKEVRQSLFSTLLQKFKGPSQSNKNQKDKNQEISLA